MAGDWIKMRTDLDEDPAVIGVAESLGIEEDLVIGKLWRLWKWADQQTTDGNAASVTEKWVDRYVRVPGFAAALQKHGWLILNESGLTIPKFDKHNGKSGKTRALTGRRVKRSRNGDSVTDALPEKRREEKREDKTPPRACARDESPDTGPCQCFVDDYEAERATVAMMAASTEIEVSAIPTEEFDGSAEDLAQRFAHEYRGTYGQHRNPDSTRDGFAELLRLGISPGSIIDAIHDKSRDRTEFFNDFKRRLMRPQKRAGPTYDAIRKFDERTKRGGLRDTS